MTFAIFVTSALSLALCVYAMQKARRPPDYLRGITGIVWFFASVFWLAYSIAQFAHWIATIAGAA